VVPALLTPFDPDGGIDELALQSFAERIASIEGVGAVFCTGHAGEVAAMSRDERRHVTRLTVEAVGGRVPVIAGVYTDSYPEAVAMARDAREAGASAVTLFAPPVFADGATESSEAPFQFFQTVAQGAEIPLVVFQFPPSSGLGYDTETLVRLAGLPEVVAVKEGSAAVDLYEANLRALHAVDPPVPVLSSNNTWLLPSLSVGGDGILSGASSVVAEQHVELWRCIQRQDLAGARRVNDRLYPLVRVFYRPPFIDMHNRMKEALVMMGVLQHATVRPPLMPLSDREKQDIRAALVAAELI
jgi:4-hydroxy-tetrahydrodipicolinate synthase